MTENPTYTTTKATLRQTPRRWLVTGAAGFIGSNLVEHLLLLGQTVVGMDNFSSFHPMRSQNTLPSCMPGYSAAAKGWKPWGCGISMSSAPARIPKAPMQRSFPSGLPT